MKKGIIKVFVLVIVLFMSHAFSFGKVIATLSEVMKPTLIEIDNENLYVIEGTTVNIYSLKDFNLKNKFGKKGEGPEEFKLMVSKLIIQKNNLLINSFGKISTFTKDGRFLKEIKTGSANGGGFYKLKNGYVGSSVFVENKDRYISINTYDINFKKNKVLAKYKISKNGKTDILTSLKIGALEVYNDLIYVAAEDGFKINVYNEKGEIKRIIEQPFKRVKFTEKDEKEIRGIMKRNMPNGQYELAKDFITFSDYFPEIMLTKVSNEVIYVMTWERKGGKYKTFIFDIDGNLIQKKLIKLKMKDGVEAYPNVIKDNKIYQIIENEETEEWELHVSKIL